MTMPAAAAAATSTAPWPPPEVVHRRTDLAQVGPRSRRRRPADRRLARLPITGGNVTYFKPGTAKSYVIGQIQHENSGLSLAAGGTKVELTNLNVDPGVSRVYGDVTVNGKVAVTNAYLFQLRGATLKPLQAEGDTAILEGTQVFISPVAAELLNKTFKTDAVTKDLLVSIAKITVNTK